MPGPDPTKDQDPTQPELTDEQLEKASGGVSFTTRDATPPELTDEQLEKAAGGIDFNDASGYLP